MVHDIAFVGTGENPDDPGRDGFAMAYRHARAYERLDDCELVACADLVPDNARAFADHFDLPDAAVYEDQADMLSAHEPDVVSVCVPPGAHADVVTAAASTGIPAAIHCEKPVATTWADCRAMAEACEDADVQLTFNHQLRYARPFREAKRLIDDGAIGDLRRIELSADNLFDAGTHMFDVCGLLTDQEPVDWVLGALDYREENRWFGEHNENQAVAQWRYADGTYGLASVGESADFVPARIDVHGTEGRLQIGVTDGPALRLRRGSGWERVDTDGEGVYGPRKTRKTAVLSKLASVVPGADEEQVTGLDPCDRAIEAVVDALDSGRRPELCAANALQATELIFASWEASRRRARVDLPLDVDDNPLASMVEDGQVALTAGEAGD
jgi:predicted dehydrogenase